MLYVKGFLNPCNNGRSGPIMRKVRTRASREKDWLRYVDEFRKGFWGTSEMLTESDSGKVTKNCYLENILQSIDRNLTWLNEHPEVDKVVMLKVVINRCNFHIENLQPETETKSKLKKIKSDSRIATYLSDKKTTKS